MKGTATIRTALAAVALGAGLLGQDVAARRAPYPSEAVDAFATLPVQDGGRVKPLDTVARYTLLRLNERRSARVPDDARYGTLAGARLSPTEWAMDVLLFPEQADEYPVFVIADRAVLDMVGMADAAGSRRDRYSFAELGPGLETITLRARSYFHAEEKDRTRLQNQLVDLYQDLTDYRGLRSALEAARTVLDVPTGSPTLAHAFGDGVAHVRFSAALQAGAPLLLAYQELSAATPTSDAQREQHAADVAALDAFLTQLLEAAGGGQRLHWLPPVEPREEAWLDLEELSVRVLQEGPARHEAQLAALERLEAVADARDDPAALAGAASRLSHHVRGLAEARGEALKVAQEVTFHRHDHFFRAQWAFLLGFVLVLAGFFAPQLRALYWAAWLPTAAGALLVVWGVTERCLLRGRPPVSTLYETILFVAGTLVVVTLVLEAVVVAVRARAAKGLALGVGALLGAFGMFLAARHEAFQGEDTMPQLQAVLDTNFWLSTHVTTVTLGYMAALLAGFLGHVWVLGRLFGWKRGRADERTFYRWIGRMVYACLCFAVLLSTVGTILGGVWANDSWGRFWGWDPKENGALMIVLWNLGILHGRFGGFWRDRGTAVLAILGNVIVAFSWWGVNLMGVGLHSYGFQSGLKFWVTMFYVSQVAVALLAWLGARVDAARAARASSGAASAPGP